MSELDRLKDFQRKIESGELDDHYSDNGWAAIEEIKSTLTQLIEEKESNSMKKIFKFKCGIVSGTDMQTVLEIIPELETQFKQRKQFFEYYFTDKEIEVYSKSVRRTSTRVYSNRQLGINQIINL